MPKTVFGSGYTWLGHTTLENQIKETKNIIEALLFVSSEPVTLDHLKRITGLSVVELEAALSFLSEEYEGKKGGILITRVANGFQMVSSPEYSESVRMLKKSVGSNKLSMAALETLSLVVYKQPIIKAEIEQYRNVNSDGALKTLLEKRLIKIVGRKKAPGKPLLYGTTSKFLQYFGLNDLSELPTLKEFTKEE